MELFKSSTNFVARTENSEAILKIDLAMIKSIEQDLNRLNLLFSAATFMLTERDVRTLSYLCQRHRHLTLKLSQQSQKLNLSLIGLRQPVSSLEMKLNKKLENEVLKMRTSLDKFKSKLFRRHKSTLKIL